jgi:WD40 repeat protein
MGVRPNAVLVAPNPGLTGAFDIGTGGPSDQIPSCRRQPVAPGCLASSVYTGLGFQLSAVAVSPDGTLAAFGTADGRAGVWNLHGAEQVTSLPAISGYVNDLALSGDASTVIEASEFGITIADARTGRVVKRMRQSHTVNAIAVTPGGNVLSVDQNGKVESSSPAGARPKSLVDLGKTAFTIAVNPSGTRLPFGSDDGEVRLTDMRGNTVANLLGHSGFVESVAFSPDGELLVSGGDDGTAHVWDVRSASVVTSFRPPGGPVRSVVVGPGKHVVVGTMGNA